MQLCTPFTLNGINYWLAYFAIPHLEGGLVTTWVVKPIIAMQTLHHLDTLVFIPGESAMTVNFNCSQSPISSAGLTTGQKLTYCTRFQICQKMMSHFGDIIHGLTWVTLLRTQICTCQGIYRPQLLLSFCIAICSKQTRNWSLVVLIRHDSTSWRSVDIDLELNELYTLMVSYGGNIQATVIQWFPPLHNTCTNGGLTWS